MEQDRWSGRGQEKTAEFSTSTVRLPWKAGRIALARRAQHGIVPEAGQLSGGRQRSTDEGFQSQVWESVREVQVSLGQAMKQDVADERSRSSLQLSLENAAIASALEDYESTLGGLAKEHADAVGYVFAINGEINSGDDFGSAGLFRRLWLRLLKTSAIEVIAQDKAPMRDQPALAEVAAFIDEVRAAEPVSKPMPGRMRLETRETEKALYTEIRRSTGLLVHRSFIAAH